jgi:trk system potassium uptake protein TrkH
MRWRTISYLLGSLLFYLSFAMTVPLLWALFDRGPDRAALGSAVLISMLTGRLLMFAGTVPREIRLRESFTFVTLAWVLAAVFSALPFFLSGAIPRPVDAFFEAMSGLTTTGASILTDIEALPRGVLFWRSMTHWLGGMGIIVLFVAVFPRLGVSASHMLQAESPGPLTQRIAPRIAKTAKILWLIYILISLAQTLALLSVGFSLYDALTHTFGTVATGGFSTRNGSIAAFANSKAEWIIIVFMLVAGGNFALYYHMFLGRLRAVWRDGELRFYLFGAIVAALLIYIDLGQKSPETLRTAIFQAVSIMTTTGYTTADFNEWPVFSRTLLLMLMFFGGCGGSTAGAIKQIRILVVIKYLLREVRRVIYPHTVSPLRIGHTVMPQQAVGSIVAFVGLYMLIFILSSLYLTYQGYDLITSLSAVAATQGNIGPGLGEVGPAASYAGMTDRVKILLSCLMMVGRLEIYTVAAILIPEFGLRAGYIGSWTARLRGERKRG